MLEKFCEPCGAGPMNCYQYNSHVEGYRHRRIFGPKRQCAYERRVFIQTGKTKSKYYCMLCNVDPGCRLNFKQHVDGKAHARNSIIDLERKSKARKQSPVVASPPVPHKRVRDDIRDKPTNKRSKTDVNDNVSAKLSATITSTTPVDKTTSGLTPIGAKASYLDVNIKLEPIVEAPEEHDPILVSHQDHTYHVDIGIKREEPNGEQSVSTFIVAADDARLRQGGIAADSLLAACMFCSFSTSNSRQLDTHVRQHHPENLFQCLTCPPNEPQRLHYETSSAAWHHYKTKHSNEAEILLPQYPKVYHCILCRWSQFAGQDGQVRYEGHMLSEHPEVAVGSPWLKCQVCRHFFRPAEKFEDHPCCRMMYGRGHQTVCINDLELVVDQCHQ